MTKKYQIFAIYFSVIVLSLVIAIAMPTLIDSA